MAARYETEDELRRAVEAKYVALTDSEWQDAFSKCDWWGPWDDGDVGAVIDYLRGICRPDTVEKRGCTFEPLDVQAELNVALLPEFSLIGMADVRQRWFGTPEPPFANDAEGATAWIEVQRREEWEWDREGRVSEEMKRRSMSTFRFPATASIKWVTSDGRTRSTSVPPGGVLACLQRRAEFYADWLGCSPAQATMLLLTGKTPRLEAISVRVTGAKRDGFSRGQVTMTIRSPDVTPEQVATCYKQLRKALWGVDRPRSPSEADAELARFHVKNRGLSWEEQWRRWNKEHPHRLFDYPDAYRVARARALDRLLRPAKGGVLPD